MASYQSLAHADRKALQGWIPGSSFPVYREDLGPGKQDSFSEDRRTPRAGVPPLRSAMGFKKAQTCRLIHLLKLLSDICVLNLFHSLLGIVAYLSKEVPHHIGHLVRSDLSPGAWAESRRQVIYEDTSFSWSLCLSSELDDVGVWITQTISPFLG